MILGGVGAACYAMEPKDRGGRMIAAGIGGLWLIGSAGLFAARADIVLPLQHTTVGHPVIVDRAED